MALGMLPLTLLGIGAATVRGAVVKGFLENATERLGGFLEYAGLGKALGKSPGWQRAVNLAFVKKLRELNPTKTLPQLANFMRRANIGSLPEEVLEERVNEVAATVFDGEEYHLPTLKQLSQEVVAFAIPGAGAKLANHVAGRGVEQTRQRAASAHEEVRTELGDPQKAAARMTAQLGQTVTAEEVAAAQDLAGQVAQGDELRGVESRQAELKARAEEAQAQLGRMGELGAIQTLTRLEVRGSSALGSGMIFGLEKIPLLDYVDISLPFRDDDVTILRGGEESEDAAHHECAAHGDRGAEPSGDCVVARREQEGVHGGGTEDVPRVPLGCEDRGLRGVLVLRKDEGDLAVAFP